MINSGSHIKFLIAFFIFWGSALLCPAQNGGTAGSFSRIGFGPRGMAMGNALISVTSEGIYSYYNPALAANVSSGNQVDFATAAMSFDRSLHSANGSFRLPPTAGVTLSVMNANVRKIDGRSVDGYDTGTLSTNEYQIAAALGRKISSKFSAGIGFKYYLADFHSDLSYARTVGLDLGILYTFSDRLQLGIAARDLLASYNWDSSTLYGNDSSGRVDQFPTLIHLGVSYFVTRNWVFSLEGGRMIHENISTSNVRLGSAYKLHKRLTLRAGWQVDELSSFGSSNRGSAGFSVHLPFDLLSPSVDYAFLQEANNIFMHTFGLRLNL